MKSIKPGRGPSMMGAVGSVIGIVFGVVWTISAASMSAPIFFPLFGLVFIGMGVAQAVYHFKNATSKKRYSSFDIVDSNEEGDPMDDFFKEEKCSFESEQKDFSNNSFDVKFCPYCGAKLDEKYKFCPSCGKELP